MDSPSSTAAGESSNRAGKRKIANRLEQNSSSKRAKSANYAPANRLATSQREQPQVDRTYGQFVAFPGLNDEEDDESSDYPVDDEHGEEIMTSRALRDYMRSVRSEAATIPHLMVAPKSKPQTDQIDDEVYQDGANDTRGFYEDGAYVAAPVIGPVMPTGYEWTGDTDDMDEGEHDSKTLQISPQEAFTRRILSLFRVQRSKLRSISRRDALQSLPQSVAQILGKTTSLKKCKKVMQNFSPQHTYLAALSQETVLKMLTLCTRMLQRRRNIDKRHSEWAWGLLSRLEDVGTLDSDSVFVVREFGKKAVWLGIGFLGGEGADVTEEYGEADQDPGSEEDDAGESQAETSTGAVKYPSNNLADVHELPSANPTSVEEAKKLPSQRTSQDQNGKVDTARLDHGRRRNTSSPEPPDENIRQLAKTEVKALDPSTGYRKAATNTDGQAKSRNPASEQMSHAVESCPDSNTRATIDMIIAIAGEMYGQRDLLEFREVWGGDTGLWG